MDDIEPTWGSSFRELDMVTIRVQDWPTMVDWYERRLGLKLVHREDHDTFAVFAFGGGGSALALVGEHPVVLGTDNRVVPNVRVDDLPALLKTLADAGIDVEPGIDGEDEGYRLGRIRDPEGNLLQLYDYPPDRA